ncbi:MAG: hypothetical protein Kow00124_25480 [Anaerolineae bacterium]
MDDSHQRPVSIWASVAATFYLWLGKTQRHFGIVGSDRHAFERAIRHYSRALQINPALAEAHLERGVLLWRELDDSAAALLDLNAALRLRPGWPAALFCRGMANVSLGAYRDALADLLAYVASDDREWRADAARQIALIRDMVSPAGEG